MKNSIIKIATVAILGVVLPLTACNMGGTDMKAESLDENIGIVKSTDDCPETSPAPEKKDCPDCKEGKDVKDGKDGDNCPDGDCGEKKPHVRPRHKGGKGRKRRGRIVRPIPEPIEDQPK